MTFALHSAIRETATAPGTAAFALNGPIDGSYFAFSDGYADGDTMHYAAKGEAGREIGVGTLNDLGGGDWELQRTDIVRSTNGGLTVNFLSGTVDIAVTNVGPDDLSASQLVTMAKSYGAVGFSAAQALSSLQKKQALFNLGIEPATILPTLRSSVSLPWLIMDDGTVGDASSGASTLANAICQDLFTELYNNVTDTYAPLFTSSGSSTTRAAQGTAATAWAAHCRISLTRTLGRLLGGAGSGSGLTARALGQTLGEEQHQLSTGELAAVTPSFTGTLVTLTVNSNVSDILRNPSGLQVTPAGAGGGLGTSSPGGFQIASSGLYTPQGVVSSFGSNSPHENMPPSTFTRHMICL